MDQGYVAHVITVVSLRCPASSLKLHLSLVSGRDSQDTGNSRPMPSSLAIFLKKQTSGSGKLPKPKKWCVACSEHLSCHVPGMHMRYFYHTCRQG
ncbi:hypothetical protein RRG08_029498 [Elysia crispata]|uniref:Uncharacterized protein n=1 Tax=Elysia crispata TaxID=231223 RepID=A0AAE1DI27_9GAST|nr:hypothetical protein RRG08_029498 [Elysia crispata]